MPSKEQIAKKIYLAEFSQDMDSARAWNAALGEVGRDVMMGIGASGFEPVEDKVYAKRGLMTSKDWAKEMASAYEDGFAHGEDAAQVNYDLEPEEEGSEVFSGWQEGYTQTDSYAYNTSEDARSAGESWAQGKPDSEDLAGFASEDWLESWWNGAWDGFSRAWEELGGEIE